MSSSSNATASSSAIAPSDLLQGALGKAQRREKAKWQRDWLQSLPPAKRKVHNEKCAARRRQLRRNAKAARGGAPKRKRDAHNIETPEELRERERKRKQDARKNESTEKRNKRRQRDRESKQNARRAARKRNAESAAPNCGAATTTTPVTQTTPSPPPPSSPPPPPHCAAAPTVPSTNSVAATVSTLLRGLVANAAQTTSTARAPMHSTVPSATGAAKDGELIKPATFIFDGATVATPLFGGSAASAAQTTPPPTPATGLKAPLLNGAPPPRPAAPNFGAAKGEKARREAKERAQREAETARREAEERAQREAEETAQREAEERAQREAEETAQREAQERARREAEERAQREAATARREAQERARREAQVMREDQAAQVMSARHAAEAEEMRLQQAVEAAMPQPAIGLKAPLWDGAPPPRPAAPNFGAATVATTMAHAAAAKGSAPTKAAKECTAPAAPARGAAPTKAAKAITMRVLQLQREYIAGGMGHVRAAAEAIKKASAESRQRAPKR